MVLNYLTIFLLLVLLRFTRYLNLQVMIILSFYKREKKIILLLPTFFIFYFTLKTFNGVKQMVLLSHFTGSTSSVLSLTKRLIVWGKKKNLLLWDSIFNLKIEMCLMFGKNRACFWIETGWVLYFEDTESPNHPRNTLTRLMLGGPQSRPGQTHSEGEGAPLTKL